MKAKAILIGGVAFWLVTNVIGIAGTGFVIHAIILDPVYRANEQFWVPALRQNDIAALLPHWLLMSFMTSIVVAGIYSCVRTSFTGPGWKRGLNWGLSLGIFVFFSTLGYSGVFDLPISLFAWWGIDAVVLFTIAGAVMGWATERFADS